MPVRFRVGNPVVSHPSRHSLEYERVQSFVLSHRCVEIQQHSAGSESVVNRAIERRLGREVMDVMKRQARDDGVS